MYHVNILYANQTVNYYDIRAKNADAAKAKAIAKFQKEFRHLQANPEHIIATLIFG